MYFHSGQYLVTTILVSNVSKLSVMKCIGATKTTSYTTTYVRTGTGDDWVKEISSVTGGLIMV